MRGSSGEDPGYGEVPGGYRAPDLPRSPEFPRSPAWRAPRDAPAPRDDPAPAVPAARRDRRGGPAAAARGHRCREGSDQWCTLPAGNPTGYLPARASDMAGTSTPYERTSATYHQSRQCAGSTAAPGARRSRG